MTDLLANYNNDSLLSAVCDVIAGMPPTARIKAAKALAASRIEATITEEPGLDGTPMRVIALTILDDDGAWTFARLDASRFGL